MLEGLLRVGTVEVVLSCSVEFCDDVSLWIGEVCPRNEFTVLIENDHLRFEAWH